MTDTSDIPLGVERGKRSLMDVMKWLDILQYSGV